MTELYLSIVLIFVKLNNSLNKLLSSIYITKYLGEHKPRFRGISYKFSSSHIRIYKWFLCNKQLINTKNICLFSLSFIFTNGLNTSAIISCCYEENYKPCIFCAFVNLKILIKRT